MFFAWGPDERPKGRRCDLCGTIYSRDVHPSVAAVLSHLEYDCPDSPIGRRLGRLRPADA